MTTREPLYALSYVSQSRIPGLQIHHELQAIEQTSLHRNAQAGITGKLIYRLGHFVQRLEGTEEALDETMERISDDRRHRNINIISREPIDTRVYHDWQQLIVLLEGPELDDLDTMLGFMVARPKFSVRPWEADIMLSALTRVTTSSNDLL
ncbi:MAG: BLUF domain-containing protein [Pseudomonadota bacterium]